MRRAAGGAILAVALLSACQKPAAERSRATAGATAQATAPEGRARKVRIQNALFDFDYAYPVQAGHIPALKTWLDADLAKSRAELERSARDGQADAKASGDPFTPYASDTAWQVVTDLPGWLSLSAMVTDFAGGAHPSHGYTALVWDKAAGQRLEPSDLFVSRAALSQAIRAPFCAALDKQRARRRGAPVNRASGDAFDECIDPVGSTLILGSAGHQAFDRIGVLVGPYEAGSYAEGDYDITLPVTPAVLAAVKPQYRAGFALGR
jgi:hypothetical protein